MHTLANIPAFEKFLTDNQLALVDFSATWCGPCRMLTPVLEKLSEKPDLAIAKVDIDANVELGARHNIQSVPSLLLFKNGELIDRKFGARPGAEIEAWVRSHM